MPQTCVEESEANFGAKQHLSALMWVQERCPLARFVALTSGILYCLLLAHLDVLSVNFTYILQAAFLCENVLHNFDVGYFVCNFLVKGNWRKCCYAAKIGYRKD